MVYAFASADDVLTRWPDLDATEERLELLLEDASTWLATWFPKIPELPGPPIDGVLRMVTCQMVRRAVRSEQFDGLESSSESAGPFSVTKKLSNPDGNLFLTSQEKQTLEAVLGPQSRTQGAVTVRGRGW